MPRWFKLLMFTILPCLLSFAILLYFVEDVQSQQDKNLWGYRLSFVGFFLTFFGFTASIWQSLRAESAAEAASNSVEKLRRQLGSFDSIGVIGSATANITHGLLNIRASQWEASLSCFNLLQSQLSQLASAPDCISQDQTEQAADLRAQIGDACQALSRSVREGPGNLDIERTEMVLRDLEHFLITLSARLKGKLNV